MHDSRLSSRLSLFSDLCLEHRISFAATSAPRGTSGWIAAKRVWVGARHLVCVVRACILSMKFLGCVDDVVFWLCRLMGFILLATQGVYMQSTRVFVSSLHGGKMRWLRKYCMIDRLACTISYSMLRLPVRSLLLCGLETPAHVGGLC